MSNQLAPDGQVYVCGACGKRSQDRYGEKAIDLGWDESCVMNSFLCYEKSLKFGNNGRVRKAISVEEGDENEKARS